MDSTFPIIEFQQAAKVRGVCADVAKKLGLSHEHVRQVSLGNRTSARVAKELRRELNRRARLQMERAA